MARGSCNIRLYKTKIIHGLKDVAKAFLKKYQLKWTNELTAMYSDRNQQKIINGIKKIKLGYEIHKKMPDKQTDCGEKTSPGGLVKES